MTGALAQLGVAMVLFIASHFLLSSLAPVRRRLIAVVGEQAFRGLFALVAALLLVWIVAAYQDVPFVPLWQPPTALRHLSLTVMPVAFFFVVAGLTTANPTATGADSEQIAARGPVGALKITRHPMMWGIGLWGIAHLLANGDVGGVILFGGMTVLALAGAWAIDLKKRASLGAVWTDYEAQTSFLPFAALVTKRIRLTFGEVGWWRIALGLVLYAAFLAAHPWLFAVNPWPL